MGETPTYPIILPRIVSGDMYLFTTDLGVEYEVRFGRRQDNILQATIVFGVLNEEYDQEEYVVVNKGELYRVMATIAKIIGIFMAEHPHMMSFEFTGEPRQSEGDGTTQITGRTKLFLRYIDRIFGTGWKPILNGNSVMVVRKEKSEIRDW